MKNHFTNEWDPIWADVIKSTAQPHWEKSQNIWEVTMMVCNELNITMYNDQQEVLEFLSGK
jgi:hypothetical protein